MATPSSVLTREIPGTEEPAELRSGVARGPAGLRRAAAAELIPLRKEHRL